MGIVSRLKSIVTDYDDTREAEIENKEAIEAAEQASYEAAKKKRKQQAEAEAQRRKAEAVRKALEDAKKRGEHKAKPISQRIDNDIARAGAVARGVGKTAASMNSVVGTVAKTAFQTKPQTATATRRSKKPKNAEITQLQKQIKALQRQQVAQRVVVQQPVRVVQQSRGSGLGPQYREQPRLGMPVQESPLSRSSQPRGAVSLGMPQRESPRLGMPQRESPFAKKSGSSGRFGTR